MRTEASGVCDRRAGYGCVCTLLTFFSLHLLLATCDLLLSFLHVSFLYYLTFDILPFFFYPLSNFHFFLSVSSAVFFSSRFVFHLTLSFLFSMLVLVFFNTFCFLRSPSKNDCACSVPHRVPLGRCLSYCPASSHFAL